MTVNSNTCTLCHARVRVQYLLYLRMCDLHAVPRMSRLCHAYALPARRVTYCVSWHATSVRTCYAYFTCNLCRAMPEFARAVGERESDLAPRPRHRHCLHNPPRTHRGWALCAVAGPNSRATVWRHQTCCAVRSYPKFGPTPSVPRPITAWLDRSTTPCETSRWCTVWWKPFFTTAR